MQFNNAILQCKYNAIVNVNKYTIIHNKCLQNAEPNTFSSVGIANISVNGPVLILQQLNIW